MKRLLAALFGLLAIACFAGCVLALDWIWTIQKPLIAKTNDAFDRVQEVFVVANQTIELARANLAASRGVQDLHQATPSFMESMMVRTAAQQMAPNIHDVQNTVEKVTEASIVMNSLLATVQDVPQLQVFNVDQVRSLQDQIGNVTKASWELSAILQPRTPGNKSESTAEKSARITDSLDAVIQLMDGFQKSVAALQGKVQHYQSLTLYWLNLAPILATIVLGWIAISQVIVMCVAVRMWRRSV